MVLKELGKAHLNTIMSQTWMVVQGEAALGDCTLRVDVKGFEVLEHRQCTRMALGWMWQWLRGAFAL